MAVEEVEERRQQQKAERATRDSARQHRHGAMIQLHAHHGEMMKTGAAFGQSEKMETSPYSNNSEKVVPVAMKMMAGLLDV